MANKELTARVKLDTNSAESKLKKLSNLIKNINKAASDQANTNKLETSLARQALQAEKVKQATLKTAIAQEKLNQETAKSWIAEEKVSQALNNTVASQERVNQAKSKTAQETAKEFIAEEKVNQAINNTVASQERLTQAQMRTSQLKQAQSAKEEALADKIIAKEMQSLQQKQQAKWKAFQAEQVAYENQIAKAEQLKQKELEVERIRQQSLNTLGQGDIAAQRIAQNKARVAQEADRVARAEYEAWWAAQLIKMEWQKAHPILGRLQSGWDKINSKIQQAVSSSPRLSSAYNKVTTKLGQIKTKVSEWFKTHLNVENSAKRINTQYSKSSSLLGMITGKLKGLISTYLGVMGMKAIINTSDMITSAENKLNYVSAQQLGTAGYTTDASGNEVYSTATLNATQDAMDKMYASSQKVRMGYADMMSNVSKSMALAGNAFDNNTDKAIRFQEIMAEAYAIGGASAQEMSSSMYQLIQALGAGTLAGDELRSVREGAPLAYKAIEEFAQKTLNCTDSLKDMASQGKITADMVTAAIMQSGEAMDKAFAQTEQTFAQTWEQIKNAAIYAFKPISEMLRTALNDAIDSGLLQKVETVFSGIAKGIMIAFAVIGKVIQWVANIINTAITWIADNWNWLKYVIGGVALFIALYFLPTLLTLIYTAIWGAIKWIAHIIAVGLKFMWMHRVLIIIVVAIMLLIWVFNQFRNGAINACQAITYALLIVGTAILLVGILMGSLPMIIIGAVIIMLGVIFMFFEQVCGGAMWLGAVLLDIVLIVWNFIVFVVNLILALIMWGLATIYNIFVGCVNAIIQMIWAVFVDPIAGMIEWFVNAFSGGFNGILSAGANAIGQLVNMFLSGLKAITKALDAVAGTNFTGKISGWQDKVTSWGKNSNAVTYKVETPELPRMDATDAFNIGMTAFGYADLVNPMDAYDTGANWGADVKDSIDNWASKFQNQDEKGNLLDGLGEKLGLDFSSLNNFPSVTDPNMDLSNLGGGLDDIGDKLGGIGGDTGKIADSMDLSDEDLEYLRKLAEMEWKKEYTTASITVDMSNYNTINGESDLDGIVTKLSEKLYEELNVVANGVYA